ncbi:MAG: 16S rRNA (adenine(1518)-N(6)/adenine(1519)-N(6))-dimethyltransferase RsmA [Rickettsiales bacterium]|nr:16S rRNA (adenine(1518)-N(6)/adenine(1519)-N(6))-dimethyltransferase RsmA [Rickettsiales bacterium]
MQLSEKINNLPSISEILKENDFFTKKSLGQNFIFDLNFTSKIARQAGNLENYLVIEIGGGAGSLTRAILQENPKKLLVIEKDERCIKILSELKEISENKMEIINQDALKVDYKKIVAEYKLPTKIIANLPYNVGTELLLIWYKNAKIFDELILMFQKEVAERITAKTNDEQYGRLSIISNLVAESEILFLVPPSIFYPPPRVYSAIVRVKPRKEILFNCNLEKLSKITASAFNQRRKTIRNSLKNIFAENTEKTLQDLNIDGNLRAENLSPEQFAKLAARY